MANIAIEKITSNFHTHTLLCDGADTPEELVETAIAKGFDALGFSGHCYTAYDECCMSPENTRKYKAEIARLKKKYEGKLNIFCGIEQDFGSDESTDDYDYAIGSVHSLFPMAIPGAGDNFHGFDRSRCYCIDWSTEETERTINELFGGDIYAMCEYYFKMVSMLPEVTGCQIIGHFDLITKFNEELPLIDENHPRYIAAADAAVDALLDRKVIFEINTGAMAKGWRTVPYPSERLLRKIAEGGGSIIINSDCHKAAALDYGFDDALKLAKSCGFHSIKTITKAGFEDVEI